MLRFLPLKANGEVRDATRSSSTFASALISSSVMPSEKYSLCLSLLMLTKGRTAIELRGAAAMVWLSRRPRVRAAPCDKRYQPRPAAASTPMPSTISMGRAPDQRPIGPVAPASKLPSTSVAVWGRSEGFFRSNREMSFASQLGIPATLVNEGGSSLRILAAVAAFDSALKGQLPLK